MPHDGGSKSRKGKRRALYRSAKISEHRFRKVLEHFARDTSATEAAVATRLSVNSVHAIYRKLRVFFFEVGLFLDYYGGADPTTFQSDDLQFERDLLAFHIARVGSRRGLKSPTSEPPYHFAESCWRYDFHVMNVERPSDAVFGMMRRHLVELIRLCGPVGGPPCNRLKGIRAVMRQADERIEWFRRNAPGFRDENSRTALAEVRAISETS